MAILFSTETLETVEKVAQLIHSGEIDMKEFKDFLKLEVEELAFWDNYGDIYPELEKANPYRKLIKVFQSAISPQLKETWLDVGTGSGSCVEIIWNKSNGKVEKIIALDFSKIMLRHAQARIKNFFLAPRDNQIEILEKNMNEPFTEEWHGKFDGITANLVLPYVIRFGRKISVAGLEALLREMYLLLKPGGQLVWSTPKYRVHFNMVFLSSWREVLASLTNFKNARRILKHAKVIQKKGKKGIYTFLPIEETEKIMRSIGFIDLNFQKTFAGQAWVISSHKPFHVNSP